MATARDLIALLPQLLFDFTEIVPPVVPAVVFIDVDVEDPDHPAGRVHV